MPTIIALPSDAAGQPLLNAGDVGVTIQLPAGQAVSLTGATCTVTIVGPGGSTRQTVSATPSGDGTNAAFSTLATHFPVAGTYSLQLVSSFSSGAQIVKGDVVSLVVGPSL
jgi:hypothetical protein